jgi:hypothetical protein
MAGAEAHISTQRFAFVDALCGLAALRWCSITPMKAAMSLVCWHNPLNDPPTMCRSGYRKVSA